MNPSCFSDHMGVWAIEPAWFQQALRAVRSGVWTPEKPAHVRTGLEGFEVLPGRAARDLSRRDEPAAATTPGTSTPRSFAMLDGGIALVSLAGPLMKQRSKFGGSSTVDARRQVREAMAADDVKGILLAVDSPGGHVAGTAELADDVASAKRRKPVHAFIEDLGASAAYWVASQTKRISANRMAQVGSIGTVLVVEDTSKAYSEAGVQVHVISTGPFKGAGADGAPVTPEHLAAWRETVVAFNEHFQGAVRKGRQLTENQLEKVSDGRVWVGQKALDLHLIDAVGTFEEAHGALVEEVKARASADAQRRAAASLDVRQRLAQEE